MLLRYITCAFSIALLSMSSCKEDAIQNNNKTDTTTTQNKEETLESIQVKLVNAYPHKTDAYTEGLQLVDGIMYESTGHYGASYLYKYEPQTGKIIKELKLDNKYFGEGITVMGDNIYMLTYREKIGLIFDKNTFQQKGTFSYANEEGWGMTNDSTHLIFSDGTPYLYFLDPATFKQVKRIEVTNPYGLLVSKINELEYINGYIYANQWETELILKIDPATGKVIAQADIRPIRAQAGIPPNRGQEGAPEVLNGIAYDKTNNRIFITGKNWPKILEVTLDN